VGTGSSRRVAPLHARVVCESHDWPDDPWASQAQKPPEQGRRDSDILARLGKVWEGFIILDDPPVYIAGHGACTPAVSMALDLLLELRAFLLELESCFLEL